MEALEAAVEALPEAVEPGPGLALVRSLGTQSCQQSLIKEYTPSHKVNPYMIEGVYFNHGLLEDLGIREE